MRKGENASALLACCFFLFWPNSLTLLGLQHHKTRCLVCCCCCWCGPLPFQKPKDDRFLFSFTSLLVKQVQKTEFSSLFFFKWRCARRIVRTFGWFRGASFYGRVDRGIGSERAGFVRGSTKSVFLRCLTVALP